MNLENIKPLAWVILGLTIGWFLFSNTPPVIINIETNEIAKERWMQERKELHQELFECNNKDSILFKESTDAD